MSYDIAEDPYIDPQTGILRNKIGAKTQAQLDKAEAEITYVIIATLTRGSQVDTLTFDRKLLCEIHKEIFRDIYTWAGKIRTHDISKEWSYFAHAPYIQQELDNLFSDTESDPLLQNRNIDVFVARLAYYYGNLNAIHPFREGNGRAIRTFLRLLAIKHSYDVEWAEMDPEENVAACKEALHSTDTSLTKMLRKLVTPLSEG